MKLKDKVDALWVACILGNVGLFGISLLYDTLWGVLTFLPWFLIIFMPEDEDGE